MIKAPSFWAYAYGEKLIEIGGDKLWWGETPKNYWPPSFGLMRFSVMMCVSILPLGRLCDIHK
jgi:hypothetical protein